MSEPRHDGSHPAAQGVADNAPAEAYSTGPVDDIEIRGHIIDSLILPKILDMITAGGGTFRIKRITIGQARTTRAMPWSKSGPPSRRNLVEPFWPRWPITGPCPPPCTTAGWKQADIAGAFPEGFYSTTNQRTEVRLNGQWIAVDDQEMDCGIVGRSCAAFGPLHCNDRRDHRHADRRRARWRARVSRSSGPSSGRRASNS